MKFLSRTTTSRNAASFMLVAWLFVLASGVANACLLEAMEKRMEMMSASMQMMMDRLPPGAAK